MIRGQLKKNYEMNKMCANDFLDHSGPNPMSCSVQADPCTHAELHRSQ